MDSESDSGSELRDATTQRITRRASLVASSVLSVSDNEAAAVQTAVTSAPVPALQPSAINFFDARTKREALAKAHEANYAEHIASLRDSNDLPSGWIAATRPTTRKRADDKYRKPNEEPPIPGYVWNNIYGVWLPSVRLVQETTYIAKMTSKKVATTSMSRTKPFPTSGSQAAPATAPRQIKKKLATINEEGESYPTPPTTTSSAAVANATGGSDQHIRSTNKDDDKKSSGQVITSTNKDDDSEICNQAVILTSINDDKKRSDQDVMLTINNDNKKISDQTGTLINNNDDKNISGQDETLTNKSDEKDNIFVEPMTLRVRKRNTPSISQIEERDEKQTPPRSRKKEKKATKETTPKSSSSEEELCVDDVDDVESIEVVEVSPVNVERIRSHHKKKGTTCDESDDNEFHPNSMWQEPHTEDLTLYERHRVARPVPTGAVLCHMDTIRLEIRCAICLDILRNTRIVRECLHRFCESCIEQALTFQNVEAIGGRRKECPICRVYIPSRRSLVPDPYMDTLLSRLLDNLIEEDDDDPKIYLKSIPKPKPMPVEMSRVHHSQISVTNDDTINSNRDNDNEMDVETGDNATCNEQMSSTRDNVVGSQVIAKDTSILQFNDHVPGLIKIVLIQRADPATKEKYFDDLQQPYLTLTSDAPGSVLRNFLCRKYGLFDDGDNRSNDHGTIRNQIVFYTTFRLEPYVINATDTLQHILHNRTDSFEGRYMPIYFRHNSLA